jgi:hypothetical protein
MNLVLIWDIFLIKNRKLIKENKINIIIILKLNEKKFVLINISFLTKINRIKKFVGLK